MIRSQICYMVILLACLNGKPVYGFCFDEAGAFYGVHPSILRSIAKVESNFKPNALNWNSNGSYDFGLMQINSIWAKTLGPERWAAQGDPCTNVMTGAWILRQCIEQKGYTWNGIGCYHSKTPRYRDRYIEKVYEAILKSGDLRAPQASQ